MNCVLVIDGFHSNAVCNHSKGAIGAARGRDHTSRDIKVCFSAMAENILEH